MHPVDHEKKAAEAFTNPSSIMTFFWMREAQHTPRHFTDFSSGIFSLLDETRVFGTEILHTFLLDFVMCEYVGQHSSV